MKKTATAFQDTLPSLFGDAPVRAPYPRQVRLPREGQRVPPDWWDAADPFLIQGPAVISFSGGATSGYMLWRILQAHGGVLPDDVIVTFANTGREMPATLDFVHDCETHWGVKIHWLEYRYCTPTEAEAAAWRNEEGDLLREKIERLGTPTTPKKKRALKTLTDRLDRLPETPAPNRHGFVEVTYETASRDGEPFEQVVRSRKMLPNPAIRYCTVDLKIRTMRRFIKATYGWDQWIQVVGLRADESRRVDKATDRATQIKNAEPGWVVCPLSTAGVEVMDVMRFWKAQNFKLELAGPWEGNCDLCFLKNRGAISRMIVDHPERPLWWAKLEKTACGKTRDPRMAAFRADREDYATLIEITNTQGVIDFDLDSGIPCDQAACGV